AMRQVETINRMGAIAKRRELVPPLVRTKTDFAKTFEYPWQAPQQKETTADSVFVHILADNILEINGKVIRFSSNTRRMQVLLSAAYINQDRGVFADELPAF